MCVYVQMRPERLSVGQLQRMHKNAFCARVHTKYKEPTAPRLCCSTVTAGRPGLSSRAADYIAAARVRRRARRASSRRAEAACELAPSPRRLAPQRQAVAHE